MAKRLTDTEKWKREWFRKLPDKQRLFWIFLCDACDFAGIWIEDFETASLWLRHPVSKEDYAAFGDRIVRLTEDKIFIPRFVEFQYGPLKEASSPHRAVIRELKKRGIDPVTLTVTQGLAKGCLTLKDKEQDKDQDQVKDKEQDKRGTGGEFRPALVAVEPIAPPPEPEVRPPGWEDALTMDRAVERFRLSGNEEEATRLESWMRRIRQMSGPIRAPA